MSRRTAACAAVTLIALGCSSTPSAGTLPPPPTVETRAALRHVAVRMIGDGLAADAEKPPAGALEGAEHGFVTGAEVGLLFATQSATALGSNPYTGVVWLALNTVAFPVCVAGGTLYGAAAAMSAEELRIRLAVLASAFAGAGPASGIDAELAAALARDGVEPASAGDADAILAVRVLRRGLLGQAGFDPETSVVVEVETELRDPAGTLLHRATFVYVGPHRPFSVWTADRVAISREIPVAARQLCERIADELFLVDADAVR